MPAQAAKPCEVEGCDDLADAQIGKTRCLWHHLDYIGVGQLVCACPKPRPDAGGQCQRCSKPAPGTISETAKAEGLRRRALRLAS